MHEAPCFLKKEGNEYSNLILLIIYLLCVEAGFSHNYKTELCIMYGVHINTRGKTNVLHLN